MAPKRGIKRKDKSRVVLKKGESQRKDGTYDYRWTSRNGRRHSIYAQTLEELRIKEDAITRDEMDGIRAEARCTTLNELFEVWAQVKRGLKDNTYQNYLYVYRQFVAPDFGQSRISSIKKTDIKRFYNMLADQRGLKISTIESVHTVLHQVLTTAVEDNYLRSNQSDNVLRELKKEKEFEAVKRTAVAVESMTAERDQALARAERADLRATAAEAKVKTAYEDANRQLQAKIREVEQDRPSMKAQMEIFQLRKENQTLKTENSGLRSKVSDLEAMVRRLGQIIREKLPEVYAAITQPKRDRQQPPQKQKPKSRDFER